MNMNMSISSNETRRYFDEDVKDFAYYFLYFLSKNIS